ncbi:MAG: metalloregulator ArsR/SmtB family transcription factor [Alphaproteobacteria bacterium]
MDARDAALAFAALAQERRVRLMHRLVAAGTGGISAGEIAVALNVAPSSLSFHLAALEQAGLIESVRQGRRVIYKACAAGLDRLLHAAAALCLEPGGHGDDERIGALVAVRRRAWAIPSTANVLFVCRHNSARSIMAEAVLRRLGGGRFHAYSAGPQPARRPLPQVLDLLRAAGHDVGALRSKSWNEFATPDGGRMDVVIALCDMAADGAMPAFGPAPVTGLWLLPDPARFDGSARERNALLKELYWGIRRRLEAFCRLPADSLDRAALQLRVDEIGGAVPAA